MTGSNSGEADSLEGPGIDSQSKKERIRDNQRRSRARRQEYLADLEKRLADSHSTLREVELQQAVFRDAQIENARLRDLLRIAGMNENLTQFYVNQGNNQVWTADHGHRTIRPRMPICMQRDNKQQGKITRASPYSESLAISELDSEPDLSLARLSPTSLLPNHSLGRSEILPMPSHPLLSVDTQHRSIFKTTSSYRDDATQSTSGILANWQWHAFRD